MADAVSDRDGVTDPAQNEPGYGYINGKFVPLRDAAIPLLDWGFNKSDVVYDGIPFDNGLIFRLEDHLSRFEESMNKWRLPPPCDRDKMTHVCHELVARSELRSGIIYICTTRGVPPSAEIRDPSQFVSRFYGWSQQLPQLGVAEDGGLSMIISNVPRIPQSSVDATAKNFHWGDLIQARLEAGDRGAQNAILLSHQGHVAEGVGFNVFIVKDGTIKTPRYDCLKGITRLTVMDIAKSLGIECIEADIYPCELQNAEEIFISSSAGGTFPVTSLNDQPIAGGKAGQLSKTINAVYWEWRRSPKYTSAVTYP